MITLTVLQVLFLKSKVLCFAKLNKYKNQLRMLAFVVKFLRGFTRQHSQNSISLLLLGAKHIQLHVTNTWARIQEILSNFEPEQKIALLIKRNRVYPSDLNLAVTKSTPFQRTPFLQNTSGRLLLSIQLSASVGSFCNIQKTKFS